MKVVYSEESVEDLIRLREFIARENPTAAQRIAAELLEKIQRLRHFPLQGVEVRRARNPTQLRDLIVNRYVVRYLLAEKTLLILRVWHQRENRPRH